MTSRLLPGEIPISGPGITDYSDECLSDAEAAALLAEDSAWCDEALTDAQRQDRDGIERKAFDPTEPRDPATGEWVRRGIPPKPGTAPIPTGHVRLWHYTHPDNLSAIREEGLDATKSRGDSNQGWGNEPSAGVWASTRGPDSEALGSRPFVEFSAPLTDISNRAEDPWRELSGLDEPGSFQKGYHHVIMKGSVPPGQVVAIHEPWHTHYHYINDDPQMKADAVAGQFDYLLDDPAYGPAIRQVKAEATEIEGKAFNPAELRDLAGRWTRAGSVGDLLKQGHAGGFTFNVQTGKHETHGYVVAVKGHGLILPKDKVTAEALAGYLTEKMPVLLANPHLRLGGWFDTEHQEMVFDLVELHDDLETAANLGRSRDEQAIYHLDTHTEIPTGGSGGRKDAHGLLEAVRAGPAAGQLGRAEPGRAAGLEPGLHRQGLRGDGGVKAFDVAELRDALGRWARVAGRADRLALSSPEPVSGLRRSSRHVSAAAKARELLGGEQSFHRTRNLMEDRAYRTAQHGMERQQREAARYQRGIDRNEVIPGHLDNPREGVPLGSVDSTGGQHLDASQYAQQRDKHLDLARGFETQRDHRARELSSDPDWENTLDGTTQHGLGETAQAHLDAILHAGRTVEREAQRRAQPRMVAVGVDEKTIAAAEHAVDEAFQDFNRRRMEAIDAEVTRRLEVAGADPREVMFGVGVQYSETRAAVVRDMETLHPDLMADYVAGERAGMEMFRHTRIAATARKDLLTQARLEVLGEIRPMGPGSIGAQSYVFDSTAIPGYRQVPGSRVKQGDRIRGHNGDHEVTDAHRSDWDPGQYSLTLRDPEGMISSMNVPMSMMIPVARAEGEPEEPSSEDHLARAALAQAENFYPTDWLAASAAGEPMKLAVTDRGFYDSFQNRLTLSGVNDPDSALRVATHELGHRMEQSVEGLTRAEWAYYLTRTSTPSSSTVRGIDRTGRNALQKIPGRPADEPARPDTFPDSYSGKQYGDGGPGDPYELFTTSVESVMGRSDYADTGMIEFALGTMAVLG